MRRTKPPVGWEHVKNCFPVPNELLGFDLPGGAIAVYVYLLRHADRKTNQCHPSTATIARALHYCRNTVANHVRLLEERGLIMTENTEIITKLGIKKNGNLRYTIIPMHEVMSVYYERQLEKVELAATQQEAKAKAEKLGIQFIPAGDGKAHDRLVLPLWAAVWDASGQSSIPAPRGRGGATEWMSLCTCAGAREWSP